MIYPLQNSLVPLGRSRLSGGLAGDDPGAPDYLWQMNETTGTRVAVRGENLLVNQDPTFAAGKFGNAARFVGEVGQGNGDALRSAGGFWPDGVSGVEIGALSFWIRPRAGNGVGTDVMGHRFSGGTAVFCEMDRGTNQFKFTNWFEPATYTVPGGIINDTWYHYYAVMRDGSGGAPNVEPRLSINNAAFANGQFGGATPYQAGANWRFGANGDANEFINADIDQLAVWTTRGTLSNGEFLYQGGEGVPLS